MYFLFYKITFHSLRKLCSRKLLRTSSKVSGISSRALFGFILKTTLCSYSIVNGTTSFAFLSFLDGVVYLRALITCTSSFNNLLYEAGRLLSWRRTTLEVFLLDFGFQIFEKLFAVLVLILKDMVLQFLSCFFVLYFFLCVGSYFVLHKLLASNTCYSLYIMKLLKFISKQEIQFNIASLYLFEIGIHTSVPQFALKSVGTIIEICFWNQLCELYRYCFRIEELTKATDC